MIDLDAIKKRLNKATPGPWKWREDEFRPKYMRQKKDGTWTAKPGQKANRSWVMLLTGPVYAGIKNYTQEDIIRGYPDEWDFTHIIAIRWEHLKVKSLFNATPIQADADFIANAPTDIKCLIEEIERLRELLGGTQ